MKKVKSKEYVWSWRKCKWIAKSKVHGRGSTGLIRKPRKTSTPNTRRRIKKKVVVMCRCGCINDYSPGSHCWSCKKKVDS